MTRFAGTCTGANCGKDIVWDQLNGRPHPFDEVTCRQCKGKGTVPVPPQASMFDDQPELLTKVDCTNCKGTGKVLRSHFQSCPNAAKFRRADGSQVSA